MERRTLSNLSMISGNGALFLQYLKLLEMKLIWTNYELMIVYRRFLHKISIQIIQELINLWIRLDSDANFIQKKEEKIYYDYKLIEAS